MKIQRSVTFPFFFFFNDTATTEIYTLSLHDALPIFVEASVDDLVLEAGVVRVRGVPDRTVSLAEGARVAPRLEAEADRKSTRLNSSHSQISYAGFRLKKKKPLYLSSGTRFQQSVLNA